MISKYVSGRVFVLVLTVLILSFTKVACAQYQYKNAPFIHIIKNIQQQTSFRFLYRDALVSDVNLSFSSNRERLFTNLRTSLKVYGLNIKVDSTRSQVIIFQQQSDSDSTARVSIRGQVVDASTGERLPFATVTWEQQNTVKGASSNQSGSFKIDEAFDREVIEIRCSYVGYVSKTVTLNVPELSDMKELTFRLQPKSIDGNELVITGTNYYSDINQETSDLIDIGTFSPMGESNTMRALQALPSVSLSPAMSDGLHIRGSSTDGLRVFIDGITIYNQSHLFGLVDSFNSDILKRSGFFYDVAPAQFQAPPGGTLSLFTKTGSMNKFSGQAGFSNSSFRLSLEGPIKKGNSSWLMSARKSYMNIINWLNNSDLIEWGLDVDRQREVLGNNLIDFQSQLVHTGETDASFFDLHGKVYFEGKQGDRFIISGYWGGDDTRQKADRLYRSFSQGDNGFEPRPVSAVNDWQNGATSLQYQQWLSENTYASSTAGISIYQTLFKKDDFTYTKIDPSNHSLQIFTFPFENKSILNEFKAEQQLEFNAGPWTWTSGVSYHYFLGEYYENSFDRPGFFSSRKAHKLDAYVQLDYTGIDMLDIFGGTRVHYYSSGSYLKWSPRIKLRLFPESILSIGGGFSRNYQFLNQISLSNNVTSNVWVLANEDQPPTSLNYFSGGIYFSPPSNLYAHIEGYIKEFKNVRLHEINAFSLTNTFGENPWYINNDGTGKGLEFLLRGQLKSLSLTQTLSISEMKLSNPTINDGKPFYVDWDRTYQYMATLGVKPLNSLSLYLSWVYATGTPNKLATFGPQNERRLSDYQRTDLSAEYKQQFKNGHLGLSISIFNVLGRRNPWYREQTFVIDQSTSQNQFRAVPVDVYDIGFQPSFNISIAF